VQLSKFELIINLITAKTLGLTFPPGLLAIAPRDLLFAFVVLFNAVRNMAVTYPHRLETSGALPSLDSIGSKNTPDRTYEQCQ
jgi:hypothetical protein